MAAMVERSPKLHSYIRHKVTGTIYHVTGVGTYEPDNVLTVILRQLDGPSVLLKPWDSFRDGEFAPAIPTLLEVEKAHIMESYERNGGDKKRVANELKCSLKTVYTKLKLYGVKEKS